MAKKNSPVNVLPLAEFQTVKALAAEQVKTVQLAAEAKTAEYAGKVSAQANEVHAWTEGLEEVKGFALFAPFIDLSEIGYNVTDLEKYASVGLSNAQATLTAIETERDLNKLVKLHNQLAEQARRKSEADRAAHKAAVDATRKTLDDANAEIIKTAREDGRLATWILHVKDLIPTAIGAVRKEKNLGKEEHAKYGAVHSKLQELTGVYLVKQGLSLNAVVGETKVTSQTFLNIVKEVCESADPKPVWKKAVTGNVGSRVRTNPGNPKAKKNHDDGRDKPKNVVDEQMTHFFESGGATPTAMEQALADAGITQ